MPRRLAQSYKRHPVTEPYDAIVIGSGIGGLACAALLAKHGGRKVLVLERHYTPGGYTHVFHRPNYDWDVGLHYLGGLEPGSGIRRVFDDICVRPIEWADMGEVYDRVIIDGDIYDLPKGRRNLRAMLVERFPGQETAIDGYFEAVHAAASASLPFQAAKALPGPIATVVGPLLQRRFRQWSDRTTEEVLAELTDDPRLIAVLTAQLGDYGLPPADSSFAMHALVASHYFRGGYYPVGGSGVIAESIIGVIEQAGGMVLVGAEVDEVVLEGGRAVGVRMAADDAVIRAPVVISDAGVATTLVGWCRTMLRNVRGCSTTFPRSARHWHTCACIWDSNRRRRNSICPSTICGSIPVMTSRVPSAPAGPIRRRRFRCSTSPSHRPKTRTSPAATQDAPRWRSSPPHPMNGSSSGPTVVGSTAPRSTTNFKDALAARMLEGLYEQLPHLRGQVAFQEISTPLSTAHFAGYERGELYGLEHTPARFAGDFLKPTTPIRGLYLTGQDIVTCGIAGALFGGVLTATSLLRGKALRGLVSAAIRRFPSYR